ncbi:MAG TPA: beta-phosphoglucomutase [Cyclobacteriaceae bacterium]|nr:beta-phosphoglucomutase [Cyclobacteriaceae bacterium]
MKACIFDLDGVIVDTAKYHYLAWKRLAAELGIDLTEEVNERLKGVSRMESLDIILNLKGLTMSTREKEELADKKNAWFVEYINAMKPDEIFEGAKELIQRIRDHKIKIGLASSSKNAKAVLKLLGIQSLFDVVIDGTMIQHTKPHPEIFLKASSALGLTPDECIVIEDAEAGIESAVRAGMKCVGIGSAKQLHKANLVVPSISELKFDKLNNL